MIFSEKHKYVFVQLPHTACTAIGRELVEYYGGRPILHKHASYQMFRKWAGASADGFYAFVSVRNPMDEIVSIYHKFKNDHKGHYSDPSNWKRNGGWLSRRGLRQFQFVQRDGIGFQDYFRRFFRLPYVNTSVLAHGHVAGVIRFENLQSDFETILRHLGLERVRAVPLVNPTRREVRPSADYYAGMESRAKWVLGPMSRLWGYGLPSEWGADVEGLNDVLFEISRLARTTFWNLRAG